MQQVRSHSPTWNVVYKNSLGGQFVPFNPEIFIKSICPHKEKLKVLHIDAERNMYYFNPWDINEDVGWKIDDRDPGFEKDYYSPEPQSFIKSLWENNGSMRNFRALRLLTIGIGLLLYQGVGGNCEAKEKLMPPDELPEFWKIWNIFAFGATNQSIAKQKMNIWMHCWHILSQGYLNPRRSWESTNTFLTPKICLIQTMKWTMCGT